MTLGEISTVSTKLFSFTAMKSGMGTVLNFSYLALCSRFAPPELSGLHVGIERGVILKWLHMKIIPCESTARLIL